MVQISQDKWDDWMREALAGNQVAYRHLLTDLRLWLGAFFAKRVHPDGIEDLVQDTLLAVHNKRHTYDPTRPFGAWINAVARHKWIDKIRANIKHIDVELDDNLEDKNAGSIMCAKHDVEKLLNQIPPKYADIIKLIKIQELSIDEVARKTGFTHSYIKIAVHRGMKQLQAKVMEAPQ